MPLSELRYAYPAKAPGIIWFQFATSEFEYQHGDALKFRFRDLRFIRLTRPILSRMEVPAVVLPGQLIQCSFRIMGGLSGAPFLTVTLAGPDGNVIRTRKITLLNDAPETGFQSDGLKPGIYRISAQLPGGTPMEKTMRVLEETTFWKEKS